jgi:hypothetical protein
MESVVIQIILCAVAAWTWVWLIRVLGRDVPVAIYAQQNLGLRTPRSFYRLARWRWWLAAGAAAISALAALVPEARAGVVIGLLVVAVGLLTHIYRGMARFLDPRVVQAVLRALHPPRQGDEPDAPVPAA